MSKSVVPSTVDRLTMGSESKALAGAFDDATLVLALFERLDEMMGGGQH